MIFQLETDELYINKYQIKDALDDYIHIQSIYVTCSK